MTVLIRFVRDNIAVQVVMVVMPVLVKGEAFPAGAEHAQIFGMTADVFGFACAADVALQADDFVGGGHDQMQIVRNHQHGATLFIAQSGN